MLDRDTNNIYGLMFEQIKFMRTIVYKLGAESMEFKVF